MLLRRLSLFFCASLAAACITGRPPLRSPQPLALAAAFVMDYPDKPGVTAVPAAVIERAQAGLEAHNMAAQVLPFATYSDDFASRRLTMARLIALSDRAQSAQALLLVETKVSFYSELNDLFRWDVYCKVTIATPGKLNEAISSEKTYGVFMDFEHEREDAVLTRASSDIGDQVTRLANDYLGIVLPDPGKPGSAPKQSRWDPDKDSIYFVLVDRFSNGDPSNDGEVDLKDPQAFHGGDLQGVLDKLDYIQGLGFTTIWLSPVFKMRTTKHFGYGAFHGYWVEDFTKIEPRFGTEDLLVKLSQEIHKRGMKLVMDVVLNHVAHDSPLVKEHPEWFHHNGDIKDWNDPTQLTQNDIHGLPDLAQERDDVYEYLLKTSFYWIDLAKPDGFRLDAVKHIAPEFWVRYNADIRAHAGADFMLLGEDLDGNPVHTAAELKAGQFTSLFDFPSHYAMLDVACKSADSNKLSAVLFEDREYEHPEMLVTLLDNHDLPRLATVCGGDQARMQKALGLLLRTRGIPVIMYGTEYALTGEKEPANRGDMPWSGDAPLADTIRTLLHDRPAHAYQRPVPGTDRKVVFEVTHAPATPGDSLYLAGSGHELGGWDQTKAVGPFTPEGPALKAEVQLPANGVFEMKLFVKHADGTSQWEDRANRYFVVSGGCARFEWSGSTQCVGESAARDGAWPWHQLN